MVQKSYFCRILVPHVVQFVVGLAVGPIFGPCEDPAAPEFNKGSFYVVPIFMTPLAWWLSVVLLNLPADKKPEPTMAANNEEKPPDGKDFILLAVAMGVTIGMVFLTARLIATMFWMGPLLWLLSVFGCFVMHQVMGTSQRFTMVHGDRLRRKREQRRARRDRRWQRERQETMQEQQRRAKHAARTFVVNYYKKHHLEALLPPELLHVRVCNRLERDDLTAKEILCNAEALLRRLHQLVLRREEESAHQAQTEQSLRMSASQRDAIEQQVRALERERDRQIEHIWHSDKEGNMKAAEVEWISEQFQQQIEQLRKGKP